MDLIEQTRIDVQKALDEDVGTGDLTASLVPANARATATIICREAAVICGRPWVDEVLRRVAPAATVAIPVPVDPRSLNGVNSPMTGVSQGWDSDKKPPSCERRSWRG